MTPVKRSAAIRKPFSEMFQSSIGDTGVAKNDPRVNMLHADLSGLPPIMVYYGAFEMLAREAIEFAKRAKDFGVDVTLRSLPEGQNNSILDRTSHLENR